MSRPTIPDQEISAADPEQLVYCYEPLVFKIANRYYSLLERTGAVDMEDLHQAGRIALLRAQRAYKAEEGSFINYSILHVKAAIRRTLGLDSRDLAPVLISLDESLSPDDPEGETLADMIADPSAPEGLAAAERDSDLEQIRQAVADMRNDKHREIISRVYFMDQDRRQAASEMGITCRSLRSSESNALHTLKRTRSLQYIADYRPHTVSLARFQQTWESEEETYILRKESEHDKRFGAGSYARSCGQPAASIAEEIRRIFAEEHSRQP